MATTHKLEGYTKRRRLLNVCAFGMGMVFFGILAAGYSSGGWRLWVGVAGIPLCFMLASLFNRWAMRPFPCPSCHGAAPHRWSDSGRLEFTCSHCEIVWETDMTRRSD